MGLCSVSSVPQLSLLCEGSFCPTVKDKCFFEQGIFDMQPNLGKENLNVAGALWHATNSTWNLQDKTPIERWNARAQIPSSPPRGCVHAQGTSVTEAGLSYTKNIVRCVPMAMRCRAAGTMHVFNARTTAVFRHRLQKTSQSAPGLDSSTRLETRSFHSTRCSQLSVSWYFFHVSLPNKQT